MKRLCIHPKEAGLILGFSERHARNLFKLILELNNKLPHQLVTVEEFCAYFGLDPTEVHERLR